MEVYNSDRTYPRSTSGNGTAEIIALYSIHYKDKYNAYRVLIDISERVKNIRHVTILIPAFGVCIAGVPFCNGNMIQPFYISPGVGWGARTHVCRSGATALPPSHVSSKPTQTLTNTIVTL